MSSYINLGPINPDSIRGPCECKADQVAALVVGHVMGTPEPSTRPAIAFGCAMRNPGIALLVASRNQLDPGVTSMILAYLLASASVIVPYLVWSRRRARLSSQSRTGA